MDRVVRYALREVVAIMVLGGLIGGGAAALMAPDAANGEQMALVSVNRINKGDQLPSAWASKIDLNSSSTAASRKRPPLGCDAMFSSIADPTQAHIYRRCAA